MSNFKGHHGLVVGAVLGAAATAAYYHGGAQPTATAAPVTQPAPPLDQEQEATSAQQLPPNHPPLGAAGSANPHAGGMGTGGAMGAPMGPPDDDEAIKWKLPEGWQVAPNTSSMRLATYKVTGKDGDADVSVSRAGGGTDTNIQRWADQFGGATPQKTVKTVAGFKTTVVQIQGTFASGGMGGPSEDKKKWALLGAIVETPGSAYFFKMTGPESTVLGARAGFDKLVDGITPAK